MRNNDEKEKIFFNALMVAYEYLTKEMVSLFKREKSFENVFKYLYQQSISSKIKNINPEKEFEKLKNEKIQIVLISDKNYPQNLKQIPHPPLGIYYKGNLISDNALSIAIVGTRKASRYGKEVAFNFAKNLAGRGAIIISGLALGIDSEAHKGALESNGRTIAVLGSGLDAISPETNRKLGEKIIESNGVLFSEFPLFSNGLLWHFPSRNRIVSGLSDGVIIIEAPKGSGALITAAHAKRQGRKVFVVPGDIFSQNFVGSHQLIKDGARLVTNIDDILKEFGKSVQKAFSQEHLLPSKERVIYKLIESGIGEFEEIALQSKFSSKEILSLVSMLESKSMIKNMGGKFVIIK